MTTKVIEAEKSEFLAQSFIWFRFYGIFDALLVRRNAEVLHPKTTD